MKINKSETTTNEGGYIPEGTYRIRVTDTKADMRTAQNKPPMTTLSFEIIEPETVQINGSDVVIAGRKGSIFLIHNVKKAGWKSQEEVFAFCEKLGIELPIADNGEPDYEIDDHVKYFKGLEFDLPLSCRQQVKTYATGPNKGQPMLDGAGKEIDLGYQIQANASDLSENCNPSRNEIIATQPY